MIRRPVPADALERLLTRARYEVLPTASVADEVHRHLPTGATVTVTASATRGMDSTLEVAESLAALGFDVVPHLAARMIHGKTHLAEITQRLQLAGIDKVFVPSGDATPDAGTYRSALEVLEDLTSAGNPFAEVGITGYPESHPTINDDITIQAMWDKRSHATQIVSNLTFDPDVLVAWIARVRDRGVTLPVLVGLPGPVERLKLLRMAARIGVGESTRFLAKNGGLFARIAAPGGYDPLRFLAGAARALSLPEAQVAGLHLFTFNQVAETEAWRVHHLERLRHGATRRTPRGGS